MKFDLLIKGGQVFDNTQSLKGEKRDIGIRDGRIEVVSEHLDRRESHQTIEAADYYVTPGLVDLHVHAFKGIGLYGIDVDSYCLQHGVTTVVDTGSAGALTFSGFRSYIINKATTRVFALLNISDQGILIRRC